MIMKPIVLTFLDAGGLKQSAVVGAIEQEGFNVKVFTPPAPHVAARPPVAAVLILGRCNPERGGQALQKLSAMLAAGGTNPSHLIACGFRLSHREERWLRKSGAGKVVKPAEWTEQAVAERVLAALLGGFITSQNGVRMETHVDFDAGEPPYLQCRVPYEAGAEVRKIIGGTQRMLTLFRQIKAYSGLPYPVLIRGASGTGKELVAAAIHSPGTEESKKRFIPINITETPRELVATQLFGHVKGAFTGAERARRGLLAAAGDGTVFIDEVGDLDLADQTRLLRVFENRQIRVVGDNLENVVPLRARLIFATNRYLERMCFEGKFRQDLYHRLREGHRLNLPSLAERKGDLELLTKEIFYGWHEERKQHHANVFTLDQGDFDKIVDLCVGHEFHGNVRGLRGVLRVCFNDSLFLDGRFNLTQLKTELAADRDAAAVAHGGGGPGADSRTPSIALDLTENYFQFRSRARAEYFTAIYRSVGRSLDRAAEVTDVVKSTVWKNLLPEERRGHLRGEERPPDANANGDAETTE